VYSLNGSSLLASSCYPQGTSKKSLLPMSICWSLIVAVVSAIYWYSIGHGLVLVDWVNYWWSIIGHTRVSWYVSWHLANTFAVTLGSTGSSILVESWWYLNPLSGWNGSHVLAPSSNLQRAWKESLYQPRIGKVLAICRLSVLLNNYSVSSVSWVATHSVSRYW